MGEGRKETRHRAGSVVEGATNEQADVRFKNTFGHDVGSGAHEPQPLHDSPQHLSTKRHKSSVSDAAT